MIIADTRHRATCRHDVAEVIEHVEDLLGRERIRILLLDARNLVGNTPVHLLRAFLKDIAEAVLHSVLVDPHTCRQLVAAEVLQRGLVSLFISVCLFVFHWLITPYINPFGLGAA